MYVLVEKLEKYQFFLTEIIVVSGVIIIRLWFETISICFWCTDATRYIDTGFQSNFL